MKHPVISASAEPGRGPVAGWASSNHETTGISPMPGRPGYRRRPLLAILILMGVAIVVGVMVSNLIGGAVFFYNADEAVDRREELAGQRFRVQGTPVERSITETFHDEDPVVAFAIAMRGVAMDVIHFGDPADLFQPGVPVVLEGSWVNAAPQADGVVGVANDGWYFASDRMLVKHDNDYINEDDYDKRTLDAQRSGVLADQSGSVEADTAG